MKAVQLSGWIAPLDAAATIQEECWVLLYSGTKTSYSGRYSYLAHGLKEHITAEDFAAFASRLSQDRPWYENMWFGTLGYGLKDNLEKLPKDTPSPITLPALHMMQFAHIWQFDHEEKRITCFSETPENLPKISSTPQNKTDTPEVLGIQSNMSGQQYRQHVNTILEHIQAGNLYQANLTRKFYGNFAKAPDEFSLFCKLCEVSPAPYSAFIKTAQHAVISSSPELFLHVDANGAVRSRPIKGTSPRFVDTQHDEKSRQYLAASDKDKAENLMIVDLMRNDLSRGCLPGSITTSDMFEITSHANVHHMATTVHGMKRSDCTPLELVQHCFPPGSMTGAPKIRAMQLCSELEKQSRGVYAGAIGFFNGAGGCELSVVIRTVVLQGTAFEFQVGGGIVADSTDESEQTETFAKAAGIIKMLNVRPEILLEL